MKGKININRTTSNRGPDTIRIEVIDDSSQVSFLDLRMTPEDFAYAITGLGHQECDFSLRFVNTVGKVRQVKEEIVPVPEGWLFSKDINSRDILAPYEVDGWKGHDEDLTNRHRQAGKNAQKVVFVRFVEE